MSGLLKNFGEPNSALLSTQVLSEKGALPASAAADSQNCMEQVHACMEQVQ